MKTKKQQDQRVADVGDWVRTRDNGILSVWDVTPASPSGTQWYVLSGFNGFLIAVPSSAIVEVRSAE